MAGEPDFGNKEFPGVGFPTPVSIPGDTVCRTLKIPADGSWEAVVMGALWALALPYNWQQLEGGVDREDAAARAQAMIEDAYANLLCPITTVDTPYWDNSTDVDDEAEIVDQTWYGEVVDPTVAPTDLTFIENVSIWAFTGLLAVATPEVGFAPAIAFATIAPKFVIAIRTGDLGRIIRLYVDGSKAAEVTDDGSGDIVAMPVVANPALGSHQIYITAE